MTSRSTIRRDGEFDDSVPGMSPEQPTGLRGYMIPYIVGKLAPNRTLFKSKLVMCVPRRGYFRAVYSQKGDKFASSPPLFVKRL